MLRLLIIYLSTLVVLLPVDFAFLGTIGKKLFSDHVGDMVLTTPRMLPAVLFYAIYLVGVVAFVNGPSPANWQHNVAFGALFGLVAYSTFELTNMALLKHWEWSVVLPDIAWGAAMTAISASVGGLLAAWILTKM